jgi:predicted glycoside hydrolase/deacetylase ChbG (UPF0249 family)
MLHAPELPRIPDNLRINADDFGLTPAISRAITQAHEAGLINSCSVVPFSCETSEALLARLSSTANIRIGAHLTLVEVPLLTRPRAFPDGVPPRGHRELLVAVALGRISTREVYAEWKAQLTLLQERIAPAPVQHLDSHQHVHLLPGLWQVTTRLARELAIPTIRSPYERSMSALCKDFPLGAGLQLLAWAQGRDVSEAFFGVGSSMAFSAQRYASMARLVANRPHQRFELMVHPDEDSRGRREVAELSAWLEQLGYYRRMASGAFT